MDEKFGALPPKNFEWMIEKDILVIVLVRSIEKVIVKFQEIVEKLKSGEIESLEENTLVDIVNKEVR